VTVLLGTSGWHYSHWRTRFYPDPLATADWLAYYAAHFDVVEVNNTFYRLPDRGAFEAWHETAPEGFRFALKMSRFLSHIKRLADAAEPIERFLGVAKALGQACGPTLIQLPATFQADVPRLQGMLEAFPRGERVAVEFRHRSWWAEQTRRTLARFDAALCLADRGSRPAAPLWRTADWG
jgi:uncharacterized protein YecE (DUF72 family)